MPSAPSHIRASECSVLVTSRPSPRREMEGILQELKVIAKARDHQVGSMTCYAVNRGLCRQRLGTYGLETVLKGQDNPGAYFDVWSTLFDKYGFVKEELVDHDYHKGTGCWGRELDKGTFIYVLDVQVPIKYRRAGIGSLMIRKLLESDRVKAGDFLVACEMPVQDPSANTMAANETARLRQIDFLRHNHFRRIGRTFFFACCSDKSHPSRNVRPADEPESDVIAYEEQEEMNADNILFAQGLSDAGAMSREAHKNPIHNAVGLSPDMRYYYTAPGMGIPVDVFIRQCHTKNPTSVRKRNQRGLTPLHAAAINSNLLAVKTLLELGATDDLTKMDNAMGKTPYELVKFVMDVERETVERTGKKWDGFSQKSLEVAWTLRRAAGEDVGPLEEYVAQYKWGCTCGKCALGWFSLRMRYRMMREAAMLSGFMTDSTPSYRPGRVTAEDLVNAIGLDYIPPRLRRDITEAFWLSYRGIVVAILDICCCGGDIVPQPLVALRAANTTGNPRPYIEHGAKADYAVDFVLNNAKTASLLGDGDFDTMMEESETDANVRRAWDTLPRCENDLEFDSVRRQLKLSDTMGPYFN
ncbi:hypothetical protein EIP91_010746 [Steccherinum ochraceum]|uniref:Uncharacterized protein n=1 Tax=Steccherinum ochraceum TaxID=92696 RepID=A0A4R0RIP4_9APHY|nr:hypothetical protein EIP91_010746 [Steccherinum ochraceum]